jgi:hypothetical protein
MNAPRTDNIARGNHVVPTEWAEELEYELISVTEQRDRLLKMNDVLCQFMNDEFGMILGDPRLTKLQAQMEQADTPKCNK